MTIVFATVECSPFVKVGGLADVAAGLPAALAQNGHTVRVYCPYYTRVLQHTDVIRDTRSSLTVALPHASYTLQIYEYVTPDGATLHFLRNDDLFGQGDVYESFDGEGRDVAVRFAVFQHAILAACEQDGVTPDIVHAHDWHTALLPALIDARAKEHTQWNNVSCVFTIHNLEHQGCFPSHLLAECGIPPAYYISEWCEHFGEINWMKCALMQADAVTTVSPTYAHEICTPACGFGFDGLLRSRTSSVIGILNGCDTSVWSPATDRFLPAQFSSEDFSGKAQCKAALQEMCGFSRAPDTPLFGVVARITTQKGIDVVAAVIDDLCTAGAQCVILGKGDAQLEALVHSAVERHPHSSVFWNTFDESKAHVIEAGADIFLMPSRFEPCGLNQMYSQLYGTLPIVHRTGGLADTVCDATPVTRAEKRASGFVIDAVTPEALRAACARAMALYRTDPAAWRQMQVTAMRLDYSWTQSARAYSDVYASVR